MLLAIDASTKSTGVSVFNDDGRLITYKCLTASGTDVLKRIKEMTSKIMEFYKCYNITEVIMEDVLPEDVRHNQDVFNALHYLQAEVVMRMYDEGQKVNLCTASHWRKICGITTGRYGKREVVKAQSIALIKEKFGIDANDDICDSICLGWSTFHEEKESAF